MALVDSKLRYVRVNEGLAMINATPAPDHIGKTVREIVPDFADMTETVLQGVISTREPVLGLEISGPTPGDPSEERHMRLNLFPILEEDSVIGAAALILDITEAVRARRELAEKALRLHERVVQDLTVAQLAQATENAAKVSEAIERALAESKRIASEVLLDEILSDV